MSGALKVGYEDMAAFKTQLGQKIDNFQKECTEMNTQLATLLGSWSGSQGAKAFEQIIQTIGKQIGDLSQNLDATQSSLGLANTYYAESDQEVASAFTKMLG